MEQTNILIAVIAAISAGIAVGAGVWTLISRSSTKTPTKKAPPKMANTAMLDLRIELDNDGSWKGKILAIAAIVGAGIKSESIREGLTTPYEQARWPGKMSDDQIVGIALLIGMPLTLVIIFAFLLTIPPLFFTAPVLGFAIGYMSVKGWICNCKYGREGALFESMPFIMDLVTMSMKAGSSFQMALEQLVEDYADHPSGDEFYGVLKDIQNGLTLIDAVGNFRDRISDIPPAVSFADDIIQSQKLGRPLAETLEQSAERFKTSRIMAAREKAGKAKVKILIPGVLILFASLLILFGPFVVKFMTQETGIGF